MESRLKKRLTRDSQPYVDVAEAAWRERQPYESNHGKKKGEIRRFRLDENFVGRFQLLDKPNREWVPVGDTVIGFEGGDNS